MLILRAYVSAAPRRALDRSAMALCDFGFQPGIAACAIDLARRARRSRTVEST